VGKACRLSTELLDRELGPCAGIPSRGSPIRISIKRELFDTSVKSHRAGSLHSLSHLYSALLLALTFRVSLTCNCLVKFIGLEPMLLLYGRDSNI
jgi:hypothetical protein